MGCPSGFKIKGNDMKRINIKPGYYNKGFTETECREGKYVRWEDAEKMNLICEDFVPTPENINNLPEKIRDYIHDIEANGDPAGTIQDNACLRENVKGLSRECEVLKIQINLMSSFVPLRKMEKIKKVKKFKITQCPNCKEPEGNCACIRNICVKCGKPVGNITFTVCDECWDKKSIK